MIYFIRSGQYVKIGVSNAPKKRIAAIQSGNPNPIEILAIIDGSYEQEAALHQLFADAHHMGEWFVDCPAIRNKIATLPLACLSNDAPDNDNWRFEIKRKPRKAARRNSGSTAGEGWYYWVIRVHSSGKRLYYGNLGDVRLPGVQIDTDGVNSKFRRMAQVAPEPTPTEAAP